MKSYCHKNCKKKLYSYPVLFSLNYLSPYHSNVHTVLETILKSLHICAFDFSLLSTYNSYFVFDSNALFLVSCVCRHGCGAMLIENESENEDLDLGTVRHKVKTRVTLPRERKLDWLSKPRPMASLHKESFAETRSRACPLNAGKGWGGSKLPNLVSSAMRGEDSVIQPLVKQRCACIFPPSLASLHSLLLMLHACQK